VGSIHFDRRGHVTLLPGVRMTGGYRARPVTLQCKV
jgi:hypothetical protein